MILVNLSCITTQLLYVQSKSLECQPSRRTSEEDGCFRDQAAECLGNGVLHGGKTHMILLHGWEERRPESHECLGFRFLGEIGSGDKETYSEVRGEAEVGQRDKDHGVKEEP